MDFNWGDAVPTGGSSHIELRDPDDAMRILRTQCLEMCGGVMPTGKAQRVGLVVSAIGALTLKTVRFLKQTHPHAPAEQLAASGQHAMSLLTAAATFVLLELFNFDFDAFSAEMAGSRTWGAKFSDN
jgi:hypothetical protein